MPIPSGFVSYIDLGDPLCYPGSGLIIEDLASPSCVWNISASGTTYDSVIGALSLTTQNIEANTLLVPTGTGPITICGWIKVNSYTYANVFNALAVVGSNSSGNSFRQYPLYGATPNKVAVASATNVPTGAAVYAATEQDINEWCFVAIKKDTATNTAQIITYLNGVNDVAGTYGSAVTTDITYSGTFSYGAINTTKFGDSQNNMSISQQWIYSSFLSDADILDLYNATKARYALQTSFDFQNPACFTNGGTAITDLSGNGNNFTLNNTSYTYDGTYGSILFPSGTYADGTPSDYAFGTAAFSILAWVKFNTSVPGINISHFGGSGTGERTYFYWRSSDNFIVSDNAGSAGGWVQAADNEWHLLALTRPANGTVGDQEAYIDGVLIPNNPANFYNPSATLNATLGAARLHDTVYGASGDLELATYDVYTAELSAGDILAYYNDTYTRFNPPPTPVASYSPFDNASYPGTGNTWFDLSVNNNDLALSNQTFDTTPVKSFSFANGYASDPTPTNFPTNTFTFDTWVKFNSNDSDQILYAAGKNASASCALLAYNWSSVNSGKPFIEMGGGVGRVNLNLNPTLGVWYNIAWTADGTTSTVYVDGVLDNSGSQGASIPTVDSGFILGQITNSTGGPSGLFYSDASFGQFDVYNEALDAGTILQNYDDTKNQYVTPIAEYDFQNGSYPGSGTTVFDLSGTGNTLAISAGGTWVSGTPNYFDLQGDTAIFKSPAIGGIASTNVYTLNTWYYLPTSVNNSVIFDVGSDAPNTQAHFGSGFGLGTLYGTGGFGLGVLELTGAAQPGWNFISYVSTGSSTTAYLNGASVGSTTNVPALGSNTGICLGTNLNNANPTQPRLDLCAVGRIGYASVYNVALGSTQITDIYNATVSSYPPVPPPPSSNGVGGRQFAQGFNG